jgi:hypothetical protein
MKVDCFKDTCFEFLKNEDIKREFNEVIRSIVNIVYNELYIYVWFICIYNVFLIFIILANLFLTLRTIKQYNLSFS